jgi:pyruvate-formate lyase-activating enzyme
MPEELRRVIDLIDIIAMDLKLPSSTGERAFWDEHMRFLKIASRKQVFVKAVVTSKTTPADIRKAVSLIAGFNRDIPFIIQPAAPVGKVNKMIKRERLFEFMRIGIDNRLEQMRVIPQMHKIVGIK